jgi:hypothetical protein
MFLVGIVGYALAMPGTQLFGATLDAHTLLVASLALLLGHQAIFFAIFAKMFSINERLMPEDPRMNRFFNVFDLEKGLLLGVAAVLVGFGLLGWAVLTWRASGFGELSYAYTMRRVIPGVVLAALGTQTILSSFIISILSLQRRR